MDNPLGEYVVKSLIFTQSVIFRKLILNSRYVHDSYSILL